MTTKPTCETCQAWVLNKYQNAGRTNEGMCRLNPPLIFRDSTDHCMQHIPIEAECESPGITEVEELYKKRDKSVDDRIQEAMHAIQCVMGRCDDEPARRGLFHVIEGLLEYSFNIEYVRPKPKLHPDGDHPPEVKLKDACERMGKANDRITELEAIRESIDIGDVIARYTHCHGAPGKDASPVCPWDNGVLEVNGTRQSWKCRTCDIGGDVFAFLAKVYENREPGLSTS